MKAVKAPEPKVILIGDPSAGKTSLISMYSNKNFDPKTESTVGASFFSTIIETSLGPVQLHIWDTAGQERYKSLIPMYSRNATAAILVLDVNNIESFKTKDGWIEIVKQNSLPNCKVYVAANKSDLECKIPFDELILWTKEGDFLLYKTSAKDFNSVDNLFKAIAENICLMGTERETPEHKDELKEENKNGCC